MGNDSIITEEMKSMIGMEFGKIVHDVDKTMLRLIAEGIDDPDPRWHMEAAPGFIFSAMVSGGGGELPDEKLRPLERIVAGGGEWEFMVPVKAGDTITCTSKLADLYERKGKAGTLLFLITETIISNQNEEVVALSKSTLINY